MDELKRFIEQNRSQFDTNEPADGHFDRFLARLEAENATQASRWNFRYLLKIAAVLVVSVGLRLAVANGWVGHSTELITNEVANAEPDAAIKLMERTTRYVKSKTEPEYTQTQKYYITLVDNRLDEIRTDQTVDEKQKAELLKAMSEMDELFVNLQKELKANPDNEVLIDAMINHYQTKIEVLNKIISNLNSIKQLNTQQDEKVDL